MSRFWKAVLCATLLMVTGCADTPPAKKEDLKPAPAVKPRPY